MPNKRIQPTSVSSLRSSTAAADPCRYASSIMRFRIAIACVVCAFADFASGSMIIFDLKEVQRRAESVAVYQIQHVTSVRVRTRSQSNAPAIVYQYALKVETSISGTPRKSFCTYQKLGMNQRFLLLLEPGNAVDLVNSDWLQSHDPIESEVMSKLAGLDCAALPALGQGAGILRLVRFGNSDFVLAQGVIVPGCPLSLLTGTPDQTTSFVLARDFHYAVTYSWVEAVLREKVAEGTCEAAFVYSPDDA